MKGAWVGLRMIFRAFFSHSDGAQTLRLAIEERNRDLWPTIRGSRAVCSRNKVLGSTCVAACVAGKNRQEVRKHGGFELCSMCSR